MRRRKRPAAAQALLGVGTALCVLIAAEAGLRLAGFNAAYRVEDIGSWRFAPNLHDFESRGPRDLHSFRVTTNADGLRTPLPRTKTPGVRRICVMGDSTVFGWGVDDGGSVAEGAMTALPTSFEVLNAGQPGYSSTMAAWLYGVVVADYTPDLTILFLPMHDTNRVLVSDREVLGASNGPIADMRVTIARESRIYSLLRGWLYEGADRPWLLPDDATSEPHVPRVSDAERTADLESMVAWAASWGGTVEVGYLAFKQDIEGPGGERPTEAWAKAWSADHHTPLVDLRGCCTGQAGLVLADQPGHLTHEGNAAVGKALADVILAQAGP